MSSEDDSCDLDKVHNFLQLIDILVVWNTTILDYRDTRF